ncbi:hypothetical protein QP938_09740 [Porticoccaceae bacterium LTM1]|nr:hypothetical protein QP938_09740 [Porticoccaceae bacterium LTM1]
MQRLFTRFIALLVSGICGIATAQTDLVEGNKGNCTSFEWITDVDGAEKAAMVVTANVAGRKTKLQFDTGSDVSGLYLGAFKDLTTNRNEYGYDITTIDLKVGELDLGRQPFHRMPWPTSLVSGRIGLQALIGKIIRIDYPNQQICQISTEQFEQHRLQMHLVPAEIRSRKLFLISKLAGDINDDLFFDTGASLYELLVDKTNWQHLTGRQGNESDNLQISGWSHDRVVTTIGAPLTTQLAFGSFVAEQPMVHFIAEQPKRFEHNAIKTEGLIGNAPFFDEVVVMDLRKEEAWFGILK